MALASSHSITIDQAPLVSIIVPIYNGIPFIIETINSVRRQSYSKWELILCDNGSKDDTVAAIHRQLEEQPDERIRVITHEEHLPMAENWNRSLAYARGDYVKLLPSDDILLPSCLETQVKVLQKYPEAGFVASGKKIIGSKGDILFPRVPLKEGIYNWDQMGKRVIYAVVNLLGEPAGVLFRKELLAVCGEYDGRFNYFIDIDLHLRFLKQSKVFFCGTPLYHFRIHRNSGSASSRERSVREYLRLLDKYEEDLGLSHRPLLRRYLEIKVRLVTLLRSVIFWFYRKSL